MWQNIVVLVIVGLAAWHLVSTLLGTLRGSGEKCCGCDKGCSNEPELVSITPLGKQK